MTFIDQQHGPSTPPNLLWVTDNDDATSKAKARSHAMREWRRAKKEKRAAALRETSSNLSLSWVKSDSRDPSSSLPPGEDKDLTGEEDDVQTLQLLPLRRKIYAQRGPSSVLGAGRRNPFLAIDLGQQGDLLLDRCLFSMNPVMSGFSLKAKFNPVKDIIWRVLIEDSTGSASQGAIALSACQTDMLVRGQLGHETISRLLTAMRTVSDNLDSLSDSIIFAVSFLVSFEFWAGNHKSSQRHLEGMAKMINRRGGFIDIGPHLQMMLLWTFLVTPDRLVPYSPTTASAIIHDPEKSRAELLGFFNGIQIISHTQMSLYRAVSLVFKAGSPLYILLSTPTGQAKLQPSQAISRLSLVRLAALIYIHMTLTSMPKEVHAWKAYGKDAQNRLLNNLKDIEDESSTMMSYIWLLMKAEDRVALENPYRAWLTARMLKVIMAVLKSVSLENVADILLGYLMGHTYSDTERDSLLGLSRVTVVSGL